MSDFLQVTKKIKSLVQKIDSYVGSNVAALRTASYVMSQAREQEKIFAKTMTEACDLYISNVITAARICIMREVLPRDLCMHKNQHDACLVAMFPYTRIIFIFTVECVFVD